MSIPEPQEPVAQEQQSENPGLEHARELLPQIVDRSSLNKAIQSYEDILESEPANYDALTTLGNLYIFKGAAYETDTKTKKAAYNHALTLTTTAMMTSSEFAEQVRDGTPVWEAASVLDEEYMSAISFWTTALFYRFDECLPKSLKPFNLRWMRRAESMLRIAEKINPDWGGGQVYFSLGIYYMMPAVAGGDMAKSKTSFERAVDTGSGWLLNRWGRAKYYHRINGNKEEFVTDLEWVVAQDITQTKGPAFWNAYCQRNARNMLLNVDQYFSQ